MCKSFPLSLKKKYRITVEDESSLEKKVDFKTTFPFLLFFLFIIIVLIGGLSVFLLTATPMKRFLPGYLKESERTATEQQHLRLDSLIHVYEVNEAYVNNIMNALNPTVDTTKNSIDRTPTPLSPDSLMPISKEEQNFMEEIRERDKYNIGYIPPTSSTLIFGSVNRDGIVTENSKNDFKADIVIPAGSSVTSVAEGKVISLASSPRNSGGYEVIIQHPDGYLSKTGRLTNLVVKSGDRVMAGQIIALSTTKSGTKSDHVSFELWHDGDPLIPSKYLNGGKSD